jgi:O-acetyl-ADP-ribose deacetylase (regulator of RNase III)
VIHTVGPVWRGGQHGEESLLADCYRNSLALAVEHGIKTLAFPCISTGAYGFPAARAAEIALGEVRQFLARDKSLQKVIFVCFLRRDYEYYRQGLEPRPL